ncbi:MAG TPA: glycosyltransferase family 4 protein [Prosthecobacter sp.]
MSLPVTATKPEAEPDGRADANGPQGLRALLIASCFPHPENQRLGVWAQSQAEAVQGAGVDLKVVSPTSYVPALLGKAGVAAWAANCPPLAMQGPFQVSYPRWPVYHSGLVRALTRRFPAAALALGWLFVRRHLREQVHSHRPEVIFAHHTFEGGELARRLRLETGLPYVIADWDFDEITDCRRFPNRKRHYQKVLAGAACVIATSERMKKDILALFPGTRVTVGHYGRAPLPEAMFAKPRPADRDGKVIILSASGFFKRKGVPFLIESFARIQNRFPQAELWLAGDGPVRDAVQAAAAAAGPRVRLLGALAHGELMQEMVWADFFALAGWDEPFATVYVEALAAGKPVVCCDDGGICDVLKDGVHGFAVPPHNREALETALSRLIGDENLRREMSREARLLFSTQLTTAAYAGVIRQELQRAAAGGAAGAL